MITVEINEDFTHAEVNGSVSEKSARAKLTKELKAKSEFYNGWTVWAILINTDKQHYTYELTNSFRHVINGLQQGIESMKAQANEGRYE